MTAASGLRSTAAAPSPRWSVRALIEVSEAAQNSPADAPRITPSWTLPRLVPATTNAATESAPTQGHSRAAS